MDNASSAESSFYDPPEQYDEKKTRKLHKNIETNFEDLKSMLMSVQENLLRLHSDFVVTVKLIEKLKTHEEQQKKEDQDESDVNATATNEVSANEEEINRATGQKEPSRKEINTRSKSKNR